MTGRPTGTGRAAVRGTNRAALGIFLLTVLLPGVAEAATVAVSRERPYPGNWAQIDYRAAPGERNRVRIVQVDEATIRVTDSGAVIRAGSGCTSISRHAASCRSGGQPGRRAWLRHAKVHTGDGDDVMSSRVGVTANGGRGNDVLRATRGRVTLNGGGGRDRLLGGEDDDKLLDGDRSGAADRDVMDGRAGGATVSYAARTRRVEVDLDHSTPDGEAGERDVLRSISNVVGGRGSDELRGDPAINRLEGGPGNDRILGFDGSDMLLGGRGSDRLRGHGGYDWMAGNPGADVLRGDAGNDRLDGRRGRDVLRAGEGADELLSGHAYCGRGGDLVKPGAADYIHPDCEIARFDIPRVGNEENRGVFLEPNPFSEDRESLTFRLRCPYSELGGDSTGLEISGVIRLRDTRGSTVGQGRIPDGGLDCETDAVSRLEVRVELNSAGVRLRSRKDNPRVSVRFSGENVPVIPWQIGVKGVDR